MSDTEYSEPLDVHGQDENEVNEIHMQLLQQNQQFMIQEQQQQQNVSYMSYAGSTSSSGESSISSTSSDESDEAETEDALEFAKITNQVLSLPRGLCENFAVFKEFFSLETWQQLPLPVQNHLQQFLPRFNQLLSPQMAAVEQTRTISMLFNYELTRFGESPLIALHQQLEVGNYRPDIVKLRQNILKSRRREQRFQNCERVSQMAKQLFISRQRLLNHAYKSSPDIIMKFPSTRNIQQPKPSHLFTDNKLSAMRARKRFFSEISQIAQQLGVKEDTALSADEEDDEDKLSEEIIKDQQSQQNYLDDIKETVKTSTLADRCIYSTIFTKQNNIEDEEAFRLQQKAKQSKLTNRNFKDYLRDHKRRKITEPTLPEFETSDIRLRDVCGRAQMGGNFKRMFASGKTPGRRPKIITSLPPTFATPSITTTTLSAGNAKICNALPVTNNSTPTTTKQHITLTTPLPPTPMPPPKISEPPALVPIQPTLKNPELYQIMSAATKFPQTDYYQHRTQQQHSLATSLNNSHKTDDTLNINHLMTVSNHADNLNLCIGDSSLLTGDHDAFNMLDNDVELQQEEVETFGGTCEEKIPAFVIGSELMSRNDSNNDIKASLLNARSQSITGNQHQQADNISKPVPKLEPISRSSLITAKTSSSSNTSPNVSELIQETHACYFSLIRDFFCSTTNYRMCYVDLSHKIDVWLRNPITALNEWYSLSENWSQLLKSAINFLVGDFPDLPEEYVPFIEHKVQLNIYQWIGAGRDSDTRLCELCTLWMEKRKQANDKYASTSTLTQGELKFDLYPRSSIENDDSHDETDDNEDDLTPPPPPPRYPTSWAVRAASIDEIKEFQRQERDRFQQPHKAYTYRMYGYESVVGPVKGIYTPLLALSKARGHSMMVGDRPNFVTILTLVRDATARLPNGEGTRAEISELLKCSQYINRDASENVLQTIVSGALDRMHTEHDPCVRYDPKRKIWIYLHRNRTEDEFERVHHENQIIGKAKKLPQRKPKLAATSGKPSAMMADNDTFNLVTNTEMSNVSKPVKGTLLTMPALVPSNPIIVTNSNLVQRQQQVLQNHIINTNKCPPVPPLKYNIPPSQTGNSQQPQQQKSLLKSTIRAENKTSYSSNPATSNSKVIKQHSFQVPQSKNGPNQNTTPIIVATPQGLQTVHVSNATSVMPTQANNQQQQQHQQQTSSAQQHANITTNLAGKRVTLNKPIIINQVTAGTTTSHPASISTTITSIANQKLKSPQQLIQKNQLIQNRVTLQTNQHQLLTQQRQQSNLIIPISMANNMSLNVHQSSNVTDHNAATSSTPQVNQSANIQTSVSLSNKQNIIRIVPASNVKTLMNSPTTSQIVNRQRIISTATPSDRPATPQQQQKSHSGLQLISNNGNVVTMSATSATPAGSIVKMSPQQFASLQQKQGQQQHIILKQAGVTKTQSGVVVGGNKPQRVILGNTGIIGQPGQSKNIVLQQIPMASSSVVVTPSQTVTVSSTGNKIQTINAKNLTPQQQRILIQNLKQQQQQQQQEQQQQQQQQQQQTINKNQIQFKTVQVMANTSSAQIPHTVTLATNQQNMPKNVVIVSRDNGVTQQPNVTRILKTTSPQIKSDINVATAGNRVITSSGGHIISLDSLIQKQGGTLRITGTGNATQTIKSNQQQITTNLLQKPHTQVAKQQLQQHQQQQQFSIVSVPNSIISLSNNSNFTVSQRIVTTQAGSSNTNSLVNLDTTKVTPSMVSTGSGRVITATAAGTKIITKQSPATALTGNIRVINTVNQTANINMATLQGKQVVLATGKTLNTISRGQLQSQQLQQQQNIVRTQQGSIVIGGQTVKLQQGNTNIQQVIQKSGNIISSQSPTSNLTTPSTQLQTVIMGNQILRVQQMPQIVPTANRLNVSNTKITNNMNNSITTTNTNTPKTIFLGSTGQTLRLQPTSSQTQTITNKNIIVQPQPQNTPNKMPTSVNVTTPNRVVLAVQGGGQIFLSPNFQGGNINLKSLQNMKVVSLAQHPSVKLKETTSTTTSPSSSAVSIQQNILKTASPSTSGDNNV